MATRISENIAKEIIAEIDNGYNQIFYRGELWQVEIEEYTTATVYRLIRRTHTPKTVTRHYLVMGVGGGNYWSYGGSESYYTYY